MQKRCQLLRAATQAGTDSRRGAKASGTAVQPSVRAARVGSVGEFVRAQSEENKYMRHEGYSRGKAVQKAENPRCACKLN
eukprot:6199840-Pleurochrysis_carterae.AAC.1